MIVSFPSWKLDSNTILNYAKGVSEGVYGQQKQKKLSITDYRLYG